MYAVIVNYAQQIVRSIRKELGLFCIMLNYTISEYFDVSSLTHLLTCMKIPNEKQITKFQSLNHLNILRLIKILKLLLSFAMFNTID